jgi:triosephosphate isomerase
MRTPFVAGNWKMNKTSTEAKALVLELKDGLEKITDVEIVVCPPFTSVPAVSKLLESSSIGVGTQNVHWEENGAYTGEISASMVKEFAKYVIIGHSERRTYFGETDETVNLRLKAALRAGLIPIVCVGETLEENEAGKTFDIVSNQIQSGFTGITESEMKSVVVAYEPVWAIGTGKACDAETANEVILKTIREPIQAMFGANVSSELRILYGGSVKGSNAKEYFSQPDIDGALVGGASLKPDFIEIAKAAGAC